MARIKPVVALSATLCVLLELQVVFVTLKVLGAIDWSWWRVLLPTWMPFLSIWVVAGATGIYLWLQADANEDIP